MKRLSPSHRLGYFLLCVSGAAMASGCSDAFVTDPVSSAKSFTLALSNSTLTLSPGGSTSTQVTLASTSGAGPVALTLEGGPTGLTGAFDPSPATTASTLRLTAVAALLPGNYTLMVRGASTGATDQTATLTVLVVAAAPATINVSFAACPLAERPVWLAFQDGAGAWTQVAGVGDVYSFGLVGPQGGLAFATSSDSTIVTVEYFTNADLPAGDANYTVRLDRCPTLLGENLTGQAIGVGAGETAYISFGSAQAEVTADGPIAFTNAADGSMSLIGFKSLTNNPGSVGSTVMYVERNINPVDGGSPGALDFANPFFTFTPANATMTISNLLGGETYMHSMHFYTNGGSAVCEVSKLYDEIPGTLATFTGYGTDVGHLSGTDWHGVGLFTTVSANSFRTLHQYFQAMGPQTLTLGAELPVPVISTPFGPYMRLQAGLTLPADYQSRASLRYQDTGPSRALAIVSATFAWLGGPTVNLSLPDFTGVSGWDNAWAPSFMATVFWTVIGSNATTPPHCAASAKYISAMRTGEVGAAVVRR